MRGPLADNRPLGPFVDSGVSLNSSKEVVGIQGTPMPSRDKNDLVLTFILEDEPVTLSGKFEERLGIKLASSDLFPVGTKSGVRFLKSGRKSEIDTTNQAVVVEVRGDELPVNHSTIHNMIDLIERTTANLDGSTEGTVFDVVIDQK